LIRDEKIAGEFAYERPRGQLVHLLPSILELFEITGVDRTMLDLVAVTTGPGSFTGLRLGIATAKTIAQILSIPIVGINTLDAISMNGAHLTAMICVAQDARKGELFCAFYKPCGQNTSGYLTLTPDRLIERLREDAQPCYITGNGIIHYGAKIAGELDGGIRFLPSWYWYPRPCGMLPLIQETCESGRLRKYFELETFYLRPPDAKPRTDHSGDAHSG
jgi:tRNA threonylcarbamoyladenosine biosynthesis protein TsaB